MSEALVQRLRDSIWLPRALLLGALLWLALTLASLVWGLLSRPTLNVHTEAAGAVLAMPTASVPRPPLSQFHLFGVLGGNAAGAPAAPETQLNLSLVGVIGGKSPEDGLAVIADVNGRQDRYAVGQSVGQSGAVLEAVYSDRVLLRFNGRQEVLKRFRPTANTAAPGTPTLTTAMPAPPAPMVSVATPGGIPTSDPSNGFVGTTAMGGAQFELVRQEALRNPTALLSQVQVVPVLDGGQLRGVRLNFAGDPALLVAAGLQSDDVVVAVNGVRIDSIERGMQVVETLKTAASVGVTVLRNGVEIPLPPVRLGGP